MKIKPIKPLPTAIQTGPGGLRLPAWLWSPHIRQLLEGYRNALIATGVVLAVFGIFAILYVSHQSKVAKRSSEMFLSASNIYNYRIPGPDSEQVPLVSSEEEKYQRAGQSFQQLVDTYPGADLAPYALYYSGNCRYKLKQYPAALENYRQFIARHPKHNLVALAHLGAGDSQEQLGQYEEALKYYRTAREISSPVSYEGGVGMVRCLLKLSETDPGRWNEAMTILNELAGGSAEEGGKRARTLRKLLADLAAAAPSAPQAQ